MVTEVKRRCDDKREARCGGSTHSPVRRVRLPSCVGTADGGGGDGGGGGGGVAGVGVVGVVADVVCGARGCVW